VAEAAQAIRRAVQATNPQLWDRRLLFRLYCRSLSPDNVSGTHASFLRFYGSFSFSFFVAVRFVLFGCWYVN
jgi:hypothetical protein